MKKVIYSDEIKYFALGKRRDGLGWGEIRRAVKERFRVDPLPTIRAMQRWEQVLDYTELSESVAKNLDIKAQVSMSTGLIKTAETQLHNLWGTRLLGEQIEYEGWRYFLSLLENIWGSEKLRKYVGRYLSERDGQPDLSPSLLE
jgi:hypothetical protein